MMESKNMAGGTWPVEVLNMSPHGLWLMVRDREYFLDFDLFPWFRRATVEQVCTVELLHEDHLHWPKLDVDLDRIVRPEKYPLVARQEARAVLGAAGRTEI